MTLMFCMIIGINAQKLTGVVVDSSTGDSIPFAHVIYKNQSVMCAADINGCFSIARKNTWVLVFSSIGYKDKEITITAKTPTHLVVKLAPDSKLLDELVITAKKKKYTRKGNPAVDLMKRVIAAKHRTTLENHDYYSYNKYQKLTLSLNEYKPKKVDSLGNAKSIWAGQAEISPLNGKTVLPVSVDEQVVQHFFRKNPRKERDIIQGEQTSGVNQLVATGDMVNKKLKDVFQDIDIYDEYVRLLQFPFLSPIADGATSFYRYFIKDTVAVEGDSCWQLEFTPNNQQDIGFRGELYILKDSTYHIKKCSLTIPPTSEVNFVTSMHIDQIYSPLDIKDENLSDSLSLADDSLRNDSIDNREWVLTTNDIWAEMTLLGKKFLVVRNARLSDYSFAAVPKALLRGKAETKHVAIARNRDDDYWNQYRAVKLTEKESAVSNFMETLKKSKGARIPLFIFKALFENYIETSSASKPSKFDIGPMMSTFSTTAYDGFRLRIGGNTTANLWKHHFLEGYFAYGFGSKEPYYRGAYIYTFNKKKHTSFEFPERTITVESTRDVTSASDKFLENNKDNMLVSIKTERIDEMYVYNRQKLSFKYETDYNLCISASLMTETERPVCALNFIPLYAAPYTMDGGQLRKMNMGEILRQRRVGDKQYLLQDIALENMRVNELSFEVKYCPGKTFIETKQMRIPISLDSPEYLFRHTTGINHFFGQTYWSNITEFGIYKRQWMGSWGCIDIFAGASAQWNKVPFMQLLTPQIGLSYIKQPNTFSMLHNMEMFMDRRVNWSIEWNLNGKLMNRVPLVKKLKLREFVCFRGVWGMLTDKNNPALQENALDNTLFVLPARSYAIDTKVPYMEVAVGFKNILKLFSVEWVHRINYHDKNAEFGYYNNGVRFGLQFTF